ncbi:MAG: hypothetical protein AAGE03_05355 [Pseudomonadota bacterium]
MRRGTRALARLSATSLLGLGLALLLIGPAQAQVRPIERSIIDAAETEDAVFVSLRCGGLFLVLLSDGAKPQMQAAFQTFVSEATSGNKVSPGLSRDDTRDGMIAFAERYTASAGRPGIVELARSDNAYCLAVANSLEDARP